VRRSLHYLLLRCEHAKLVDGSFHVSVWPLLDIVDVLQGQAEVAIYTSLAVFIFLLVLSVGAPFEAATSDSVQGLSHACETESAEHRAMVFERLLHGMVHVLVGYKILRLMHSSVSASDDALYEYELLLDDPVVDYCVCCTGKRMVFHLMEDWRNVMLFMSNRVLKGKSRLQNKSRNLHASMFSACQAMTYISLGAIFMMTPFRIQDRDLCQKKRREPLGAYPMRDIMPL